ncbi:hypothetical protein [Anaerospora hongkongensis]|uniref:hypothetical protein n=1 Tax=Anaerospora hongkongensis TaxID=244830 RepID=UPI00140529E9|nr:hypothetical protein [Anaerospora hongkongensis]
MKFIGNYILIFLLFAAFLYFLLPHLRKDLTKEQRLQKALWAGGLFTACQLILDHLF